MHLGSSAGNILTGVKGKVFCVLFMAAVFLMADHSSTAYAFEGGFGSADDLLQTEVGSTIRNNIIAFENDKVIAGVPLKVKGAPDGSTYQWTITGADNAVNSFTTTVNSYTPTEADLEKLITVTVDGLEGSEAVIYYSTLPVIYINNTAGYYGVGDGYSGATMSMQGNAEFDSKDLMFSGDIDIRLRGNSTKIREKKPFNIKLDKKADLLGMGENKHWGLLANDIDHTLMRNKLLYDFSGAIGMDVYSKSENVVLIFNNQYYGVYQLCELVNIGSERIDIYNWEDTAGKAADAIVKEVAADGKLKKDKIDKVKSNLEDAMCEDLSWITNPYTFSYDADQDGTKETYTITDYIKLPKATGGVLLEMDFLAFDGHNTSTMISEYAQPLYFKTPEYAITNNTLYNYTQKYIQAFEYALHSTDFIYHENDIKYESNGRAGGYKDLGYKVSDFTAPEYDGKHYSELFDLDSLVQNFMVCEFSMNWDSMKNSVYMYKDTDGLFHMGPEWDFDWVWGNINVYGTNTWYPTSWQTTEDDFAIEQYYQTVQWNRNLIRDPYFLVQVYEKYKEIRGTIIEDIIKEGGTIDTYEEELKTAAAANDARWSYTYQQYNSVGFEESITNMKDFINTRLAWMDEQFSSLDTLIASLGYYKPSTDLSVKEVDTKSLDGYVRVTAEVKNSDIAYVTFQVNGTHQYTAEVTDGEAVCEIPDSDLAADKNKLNLVELLVKDSKDEYIIDSMDKGNYSNAVSNYTVFTSDKGYRKDVAKEVMAQIQNPSNRNTLIIIIIVAAGLVLEVIAITVVVKLRRRSKKRVDN